MKIQLIFKQIIDKFFAVFLALLLLPLMLLISILIKINGPIFFTQPRLGKDGRVFNIIKFRTMIVNADDFLDSNGGVSRGLPKVKFDMIELMDLARSQFSTNIK